MTVVASGEEAMARRFLELVRASGAGLSWSSLRPGSVLPLDVRRVGTGGVSLLLVVVVVVLLRLIGAKFSRVCWRRGLATLAILLRGLGFSFVSQSHLSSMVSLSGHWVRAGRVKAMRNALGVRAVLQAR